MDVNLLPGEFNMKYQKGTANMNGPSEQELNNLQTVFELFIHAKHTLEHLMTNVLTIEEPDLNCAELYMLLSRAESNTNGMHVFLKPKKLGWHDNVDVHPEMKLFNLKNVPMLYETVYSVMSRNYDGNYKNDPKVHQLELTVLFFIFLCKGEDAKKLATWPGMSTWPCTS